MPIYTYALRKQVTGKGLGDLLLPFTDLLGDDNAHAVALKKRLGRPINGPWSLERLRRQLQYTYKAAERWCWKKIDRGDITLLQPPLRITLKNEPDTLRYFVECNRGKARLRLRFHFVSGDPQQGVLVFLTHRPEEARLFKDNHPEFKLTVHDNRMPRAPRLQRHEMMTLGEALDFLGWE